MAPVVAETVRLPAAIETLPRLRALLLVRVALAAADRESVAEGVRACIGVRATGHVPAVARATVPLKALAAVVRLMEPLVAVKAAEPEATLMAVLAAWVMFPEAETVRLPLLMATLPRLRALLLLRLALAA